MPANQNFVQACDLNLPSDPSLEPFLTVDAWSACMDSEIPDRAGVCTVGIDLGGSDSFGACGALWESGHAEF